MIIEVNQSNIQEELVTKSSEKTILFYIYDPNEPNLQAITTTLENIVGTNNTTAQVLILPKTTGGNLVGTNTTSKVGDTDKPVYIAANGVATAISYTIKTSVPSGAVFTDTTYTVTKNTTIHYLNDAKYVKTATISNGVLTITTVTNASSITPITAITPSVAGPSN